MKRRKDLFEKTYTDLRYRMPLHILFWLFLFGSYYYFNSISFNPTRDTPAAYLLALSNTAILSFAFYNFMYLVWPIFFVQKRWWAGILTSLVLLIVVVVLGAWSDILIFKGCNTCSDRLSQYNPEYHAFLQRNFPDIVLMRLLSGGILYQLVLQLSFPAAIKIGRSYFRQTVQQLQLAKDNLQLEFNFLKSQVNPHFLFNTLNNIYALVMADRREQAAATIARLSGFMRYALYETGDEKIPLQKEVQLLQDYVALEKLRLNETDVQFRFESDSTDYTLPPLLFMPALENAFKYTKDKKGGSINVNVHAAKNILRVTIENSFDPQKANEVGGIGLQNLQRRLKHYYGDNGSCSATAANDVYLFQLSCALA